jgi:hypothetical protein
MKTISLFLLAFTLIILGCSKSDDFPVDNNDEFQLKSAEIKNRTVVTHKVLTGWGLPVVCDPNDNPLDPKEKADQLCTCGDPEEGINLYLTTRTHYGKNGLIEWQHLTLSGKMKSEFTGQIFKIPQYSMKWYHSEDFQTFPPESWDLHFTCIGEWGTKYIGAGTLNFATGEGGSLRAKCINYIEPAELD